MPSSPHDLHEPLLAEPGKQPDRHESHGEKWLILIGALKVLKGIGFILLGVGALRLLHRDLVAFLNHWIVVVLRFDPERHFVNLILTKAADVNSHELRMLSEVFFLYAALDMIEGLGLVFEQVWAEYVTLVVSAAFIPVEFYELFRHVTTFKIGLVLANVVIVLYLLWLVQAQARRRMQRLVHRKSHQ